MADPVFADFVQSMMDDEISPLLLPVGIDLADYTARLRERFGNPRIADPLARLCRNGSTKFAADVLPSIREARGWGAVRAVDAVRRGVVPVPPRGRRTRAAHPDGGRRRRTTAGAGPPGCGW